MELKFEIPEGFEMPPDAEVGGEFQAVGTFQDNGDGTLTLIQIDGADVGEMVHDSEDGEEGKGPKVEIEIEAGGGKGKGYKGGKDEMEDENEGMYAKARRRGVPMQM
jgi:hypothetical protein